MSLKKISIIGSGNWGSVIAKIVGNNVLLYPSYFDNTVNMYVYEELVGDEKLTDIINTKHENVKYLPGVILPENVVACSDVIKVCSDADVLCFVIPQQFIATVCKQLKSKIKKSALGISLIKGLEVTNGVLDLISNIIRRSLKISCATLMGANVASGVANEEFCEATIGCRDEYNGEVLRCLFQTPYFRISIVKDEETVELCGALKNIVSMAAGFADGLKIGGDNTKAAVIRLGLMEMIDFCQRYFPNTRIETFFESCGIADLVTSCYSGRNRKIGEAFAKNPSMTITQLERELLGGQKLQGPPTAADVYSVLKRESEGKDRSSLLESFPIFVATHLILTGEAGIATFPSCLARHPHHLEAKVPG